MNFENEEQANAYMSAEAEGELEARAAHDAAVAETEAANEGISDIKRIKRLLMADFAEYGVGLTKEQRNEAVMLVERIDDERADLSDLCRKLKEDNRQLKNEVDDITAYIKSPEIVLDGISVIREAMNAMQIELDALREANAHKNAVIEDLRAEISNWKDDVSVTKQLLDEQYDVVEHLKTKLKNSPKITYCGTCEYHFTCKSSVQITPGGTSGESVSIDFCSHGKPEEGDLK